MNEKKILMTKELHFTIRPYQKDEADYIAEAHDRIYREEYGWGEGFSKYAKQVVYDFAAAPKREHAEMWVADVDGQPVGSIMLQETEETGVGQLRLFLLEKAYRRHGIGKALTDTAMAAAAAWGFHHLFLWTAEPLKDARRKYAQLGFVITDKELMTDWALDGSEVYEERWDKEL